MSRLLGQGPFVGRVAAERQRVAQHVAAKGLRRLCEIDQRAIERLAYEVLRVIVGARSTLAYTFDRIARRHRRNRRAALYSRGNRARDQVCARERTRGVVNHDDIARRGRGSKRVRDRVLPPLTARHEPQGFERCVSARGWCVVARCGSVDRRGKAWSRPKIRRRIVEE